MLKTRYTVTLNVEGQPAAFSLPVDATSFKDACEIADLAYADKFRIVGIKETIQRTPKAK